MTTIDGEAVQVVESDAPPKADGSPGLPCFDKSSLVMVVTYSDGKTSEVRALLPVLVDGTEDNSRKPRFTSAVALQMGQQQFTHQFEIEADTLEQALDRVVEQGIAAGKKAAEQLQDQQRRMMLMGAGAPTTRRQ